MSVSNPGNIPEQGQIVTVRQRRYVVTDVLPGTLPPAPLGSQAAPQNLVTKLLKIQFSRGHPGHGPTQ